MSERSSECKYRMSVKRRREDSECANECAKWRELFIGLLSDIGRDNVDSIRALYREHADLVAVYNRDTYGGDEDEE